MNLSKSHALDVRTTATRSDRMSLSPLAILGLCSGVMIIASVDRINISVAAIAMQHTFGWTDAEKGGVLAAFFVGYVFTQIFGGWLAHRYGGERVLLVALVAWSFCTIATPIAAHFGLPLLLAIRVLLGACEGPYNPAAYNMLGKWMPDTFRATAVASYGSAGFLGCFIALLLTGPIAVAYSWEAAFFIFGAFGLMFAAGCYPAFRILSKRRREQSIVCGEPTVTAASIPWKRLLELRAFWGLVFSFFCTAWVYYVLMLWMPSYFERVHGLNISQSGFVSLGPWIIMFIVMNISGAFAARLVRRGVSETSVRKLLVVGGLLGAGTSLLIVQLAGTAIVAMCILCAALGSLAMAYAGLAPNVFDLAPRYGEVLFSVLNTFGALPGIIGVAVTGLLVQRTHSFDSALVSAAVLAILGSLVFLKIGTAQRQLD